MDAAVGVDIGTTTCKALVLDLDGRVRGVDAAATPWDQVPTGAQTTAPRLLDTVVRAVAAAIERVGEPVRTLGVGVTGLAESGVLLDRAGQPVAPVIAWYDGRGRELVSELGGRLGAAEFSGLTGLPLSELPSVVKYRWLAEHHPSADAGVRWLSVPEWIVHALGGQQAGEPSLLGRTGMYDVVTATGAEPLLEWAGAPAGLLPDVAYAGTALGRVDDAHPVLGGAALTVAGHDHLVVSVGAGATGPDDLLDSCGTGEALVRRLPKPLERHVVRQAVAEDICVGHDVFPGGRQLLAAMQTGLGMWRFLKLMGRSSADLPELDEAALAVPDSADRAVVDDIWTDRATLRGIGFDPEPGEVWRAAVEAGQRRAAVLKGRIEHYAGPTGRIVATGGGLRSRAVRELKRRILGDYVVPDVTEAGAVGAARFGGVAAGVLPDP